MEVTDSTDSEDGEDVILWSCMDSPEFYWEVGPLDRAAVKVCERLRWAVSSVAACVSVTDSLWMS